MSWQLLTAISVLALSASVILQKILLSKDKIDPFGFAVVFQAIVGVLLTSVALVHGISLPGITELWLPVTVALLGFGVGQVVYAQTLRTVEASLFSVLLASQAIWIMLLGVILFNESLTALQLVGTVMIFGSIVLLIKNVRGTRLDGGIGLGVLTGLLFAVAITAWSYVGRHTDTFSWAALSFFGTSAVALLVRPHSYHSIGPILRGRLLPKLVLLGLLYAIGSATMLFAYTAGSLAVVSPLRQTSIIVTTLLAIIVLPTERNRIGRKLLAALLCFGGVLLIIL